VRAAGEGGSSSDAHRDAVAALRTGTRHAVILGTLAQRHPAYSTLRALAAQLAQLTGASVGVLTEGANAAGAYLAGAVPHRDAGGLAAAESGMSARTMLETWLKAYVLLGSIDPANDFAADAGALKAADFVIAVTTHLPDALRAAAHVVLPIGCFAESAGTYVNLEGRWQSWQGAAKLPGESRPGWKVLRVLANLLGIQGNDFDSSEEVRDALKTACAERALPLSGSARGTAVANAGVNAAVNGQGKAAGAWMDIPAYQTDMLVRASEPLSKTKDGRLARSVL
jgi:NADH-quinone oxidoreductase subunit G